ncbi:MAG: DUF11 domain-containing protein [Gammaproteobacteria bacterium]
MKLPLYHIRLLVFVPLLYIAPLLGMGSAHGSGETVQVGPFTLPPGETARIEFEADIDDPVPADVSSVSNQGTVTSGAMGSVLTDDPDVMGDNNPTVTPLVFEADVSIMKVGPTNAVVGSEIVYTITVTNGGPDPAANVMVIDTLPMNVAFISASTGCNHVSGTVTCDLGDLTNGQQVDVTITVTAPNTPGMLTNSVMVTTDAEDDNTANNSDSFETEVVELQADLSITKSDSPDPVGAGQNLVYTVTVNNAGPNPAENVVATDTLPTDDATFVSTSGCAEDQTVGGVPTCTLGNIEANGSKQYSITVSVKASTPNKTITNTVSVDSDTPDPDTSNNESSEDTQVQADSDGDGLPDSTDQCDNSNLGDTVVIDGCDSGITNTLLTNPQGCTINDEILKIIDADPRNHGQFVSRVDKLLNRLKKAGVIRPQDKDPIHQCADQAAIP